MSKFNVLTRNAIKLSGCRNYATISSKKVWSPDKVVRSPYKDTIDIPNVTLVEHVWENLDRWADKTALICGISKRHYTYHQLYKYSSNFGSRLRTQLKIQDGDIVCIMMSNSPEYPIVALGAMQAGALVTTVNPIYTAYELHKQLVLSNPKIIVGEPETIKVIKEACQLAKIKIPIITVNGEDNLPEETISFREFALDNNVDHTVLKQVKRTSDDVTLLPYSSGTTGLPKGVELTSKNIIANCLQQNVEGAKYYRDTIGSHQDSIMAVLPFYHIYGLSSIMFHKLSVGSKLVTLNKFQPQSFLNALKEQNVSVLYVVPPIMLFMGSHPDVKKEHLATVDRILCGAAPLPRVDIDKVLSIAKEGVDFIQLYGLTETSPLVSGLPVGCDRYTTAGVAISSTELKVVGSDSSALGPNELGELYVRGPQVMKGYKDNIEATKNTLTEDGWCKTGDLVSISEDGFITISDRIKELIKVKGFQVAPAELEYTIKEHPDILDVAVVGVADDRTGEAPRAFVVLKEGRKTEPKAIRDFVSERVADFKKLKDIIILKELPKNPSGKILKRILKEQYS